MIPDRHLPPCRRRFRPWGPGALASKALLLMAAWVLTATWSGTSAKLFAQGDTTGMFPATPSVLLEGLNAAASMDLLRDGTLAIAETGASRVLLVGSSGDRIGSIGGFGVRQGDFAAIGSLQALPSGRLLVTDPVNRRIQLFDSRGLFITAWSFGSPPYPGLPPSFRPHQAVMDAEGRMAVLDEGMSRLAVLPTGAAPADHVPLEGLAFRRRSPQAADADPADGAEKALPERIQLSMDADRILVFTTSDANLRRYDLNGMSAGFIACPPGSRTIHAKGPDIHCASRQWIRPARLGVPGIRFETLLDGDPVSILPSDGGWLVLTASTLYRIDSSATARP